MSVLVLALFVAVCVSDERQENNVASHSNSHEGQFDTTEKLQIHAMKPFKRDVVDHVESKILAIEESNIGSESANDLKQQDKSRSKRQAYKNDTHTVTWNNLVVPYELHPNLSKRAQSAFRKAARLWTTFTCINITDETNGDDDEDVEGYDDSQLDDEVDEYDDEDYVGVVVTEEEGEDEDYEYENEDNGAVITVQGGDRCASPVGKSLYNWQYIILGPKCETIGTAAHEIAHALGFFHAHERHDRDQYVEVNWTNIEEKYKSQFEKKSNKSNENYDSPYDYGSVMHYGITAGSENRTKPTMVPKDGLYKQTLGSLIISFYDKFVMNKHYNCTDECKNHTHCQNGGFAHPRNCSECICPSGYGGRLCDRRPEICGEELNATSNWTLLVTGNSSAMTYGSQDGYKYCAYWLKAPNGSHVEVKLTKLPENIGREGCIKGGVEIKAQKDQGLTGYRFCSSTDVNLTLISNTSTLPVVTFMRRRRNDTVIELEYRIANETKKEVK